ncbi:hypothetical protein AX15_004365 [Amanita polypyramis BW_CC]|nr:hypothetical protein AX15_004365 [Amanita polypyramis BW_CC]
MISAPSPTLPTFRAELAQLVSPLKRVRPRVPFWQLAAHRVPTLSLYRGLLRDAPTEDIRFRVRMLFRQNRRLTGTERTIKYLKMGYKWLDIFEKAKSGDIYYQKVLSRYSSLIATKREKAHWMHLGHKEMAWQFKMRSRPILTAFFQASSTNPPFPRLKPQPLHMSMIIKKRKTAAHSRHRRSLKLQAQQRLIQREQAFEKGLFKNARVFADGYGWMEPISTALAELQTASDRAKQREQMPIPESLKRVVWKARVERVANKTREVERERRGEILPRTIRRRIKGPPAHVLAEMTPEQKEADKVVRSVSEVGYVAMMKRRLGVKVRDPEAWRREIGEVSGEEGKRMRRMVDEVRKENERRRMAAEPGPSTPR